MKIPTYHKTTERLAPPEGSHYIIARNGKFLRKKMWWVDAVVQLDDRRMFDRSFLTQTASMTLLLPPLPISVLAQMLKFSKLVYDRFGTEVCMLLFFEVGPGYTPVIPLQRVSRATIDYDTPTSSGKKVCVGDIHSHGYYPAGQSEVDEQDEEYFDGVHVIIGDMERYPYFSLSAQVTVNGSRFVLEDKWIPVNVGGNGLAHIDEGTLSPVQVPEDWIRAVTPFKEKIEEREKFSEHQNHRSRRGR